MRLSRTFFLLGFVFLIEIQADASEQRVYQSSTFYSLNCASKMLQAQPDTFFEQLELQAERSVAKLSKQELELHFIEIFNHYHQLQGYLPGLSPQLDLKSLQEVNDDLLDFQGKYEKEGLFWQVYGNIESPSRMIKTGYELSKSGEPLDANDPMLRIFLQSIYEKSVLARYRDLVRSWPH